jgi:regulator of sigma E protease
MFIASTIIGVIITIAILSIIVLLHEFGHFITAKKLGIKVEEFGLGFPPKVWGKKIGETLYSINRWPIGGFVKLYGEDEVGGGKIDLKDPTEKITDVDRAFFARPVWQRALVVFAGVVMNALLSFFIFYIFLYFSGFKTILPLYPPERTNYPHFSFVKEIVRPAGVYVEEVIKNSPAVKAGIKPPVLLLSVNGEKIRDAKMVTDTINKNKGKVVLVKWQEVETGKILSARVTPRISPPKNEGAFGVGLNELPVSLILLDYASPQQKLLSGIAHPINLMSYNFDVLGQLINNAAKQKKVDELGKAFSGPVGIAQLGGEINRIENIKIRILQYLNLAGLISISLAIFNVLPIPALDGGRLFFILIEGVVGKKVSPKVEAAIHAGGMVILMALILLVTFKDLLQLFR